MCGITGWVNWREDLKQQGQVLQGMMDTLVARGPDAEGQWLSQHVALGHRRLAVVDPLGGAQPMCREREGKTYVISYNGELYNTSDLRQELIKRGFEFSTNSDTEALLLSYIEWGPDCVERLNGIFAFAIWDESGEVLFMARDRLGVKPLFYAPRDNSLIFASEIKALFKHYAVQPILGEEGLAEILIMGPARTPGHGVFERVHELRPGHCLSFSRKGLKTWRYWSLVSKPHTDDLETTVQNVKYLVKDSVERQLVADVPICTLLSGGLDSSAITAFATQAFQAQGLAKLHTYSVDYQDNDLYFRSSDFQPNADQPWITRVTGLLDTVHHSVLIDTPELATSLLDATLAKDLPGMADIDSSLLLFCREVKKGATVALSGECADEIFGGYPWFQNEELLQTPMFPWVRFLEQRISLWNSDLFRGFQPREYLEQRYRDSLAEVPKLDGEGQLAAKRREMFYLNINWFMNTLLDRKDRMSMATGLEVRVPFADHRLVEYAWNIPWELKMCDNIGKGILRRALQGVLPADVLYRQKSPYPKTHNPSYTEAVRGMLRKIFENPQSPLHQLINKVKIGELLDSSGEVFDRPFFGQLMRGPQLFAYLIQLNTWLERYKIAIK